MMLRRKRISRGMEGGGAACGILRVDERPSDARAWFRLAASSRRPAAPLSGDSPRGIFRGWAASLSDSSGMNGLLGEFDI